MQLVLVDKDGRKLNEHTVWSPRDLAAFLSTTENSLHYWRSVGRGPQFRKGADGWSVEYVLADVMQWFNKKPWSRPSIQRKAA